MHYYAYKSGIGLLWLTALFVSMEVLVMAAFHVPVLYQQGNSSSATEDGQLTRYNSTVEGTFRNSSNPVTKVCFRQETHQEYLNVSLQQIK
jgi:hypothetical protein